MTTTKIVIYINIVMCKNIHFGSKAIVVFFHDSGALSMLGVGRVPIFKQRFFFFFLNSASPSHAERPERCLMGFVVLKHRVAPF